MGASNVCAALARSGECVVGDLDNYYKVQSAMANGAGVKVAFQIDEVFEKEDVARRNPKTAINIPSEKKIVFNLARWLRIKGTIEGRVLLIHEFIGVMGFTQDLNYELTGAILEKIQGRQEDHKWYCRAKCVIEAGWANYFDVPVHAYGPARELAFAEMVAACDQRMRDPVYKLRHYELVGVYDEYSVQWRKYNMGQKVVGRLASEEISCRNSEVESLDPTISLYH